MYAVQCRVNGSIVDEERCATLADAWDAIEGHHRVLVAAGASIIVHESRQLLVAREPGGWVSVTRVVEAAR